MPLVIKHKTINKMEMDCPVIVCDYCEEEITDAKEGNYEFVMGGLTQERIFFTHKKCCHPFEASHKLEEGQSWGAMGLEFLLVCLKTNLDVDMDKATVTAKLLNRI